MSLFGWLRAKKYSASGKSGRRLLRDALGQTTLPLISPRRGRRILRREQLFSVVRESMIRGGVLSTSYQFKVLTLDGNGDSFLVLVDLALSADLMPDEYLLQIERWIQAGAQSRHDMAISSVYWRRKAVPEQRGEALRAAVSAQTRGPVPAAKSVPMQPVSAAEIDAFARALQTAAAPVRRAPGQAEPAAPVPESHSDFAALSETQYGKL